MNLADGITETVGKEGCGHLWAALGRVSSAELLEAGLWSASTHESEPQPCHLNSHQTQASVLIYKVEMMPACGM